MTGNPLPPAEYLRDCFLYQPEDGRLLWKERPLHHFVDKKAATIWNAQHAGDEAGCISSTGYRVITLRKVLRTAHRVIWKMTYEEDAPFIDHKNNVRSDNRLDNLRAATREQNAANRLVSRNNKAGLKGVRMQSKGKKYSACIGNNGVDIFIGTFRTKEEAHEAYCQYGRMLHNEFFNPGYAKAQT